MTEEANWLPALITLEESKGDWKNYVEKLYASFRADFLTEELTFLGKRLSLRYHPIEQQKVAAFWHLISEGMVEVDRLTNLRRSERIAWIRPILESVSLDRVRVWHNTREGEGRVLLATPDFSFVVVVADRKKYYLLLTAFFVEHEHRRQKLQEEYEKFSKTKTKPKNS